jgi:hypothetical protein
VFVAQESHDRVRQVACASSGWLRVMESNLTIFMLGIATSFDLPTVNCSIAAQHYAMSHTDKISVGRGTCATFSGRNSIGSYFESPSAVSATVPFTSSAPPGAYTD